MQLGTDEHRRVRQGWASQARPWWGDALAAGLAGALMTVPLAWTATWALALLSAAALVLLLTQVSSKRRALLVGSTFGTAWVTACTWWLTISMHRYGGLPAPLAALAVVLLAAALSTYLAIACGVWVWLHERWRPIVQRSSSHPSSDHASNHRPRLASVALAAAFASLWCLAEWARGRLFTGFPWGASGYTQVDSPLAGLAPWVGVYGMGAALAFVAAWVVLLQGPWWLRASPLMLAAAASMLNVDMTREAGTIDVSLVQTNVGQDEKFNVQRIPQHLAALRKAVAGSRASLVVAPETAIPILPADLGPEGLAVFDALMLTNEASQRLMKDGSATVDLSARSVVDALVKEGGPVWNARRGALLGLPLGDYALGYTNSMMGFGGEARAGNERYRYDKHHLVPFGELIPWGFKWFVDMMNIPLGDFARGPVGARSFNVAGQRVGPNICYEDLFGEELAQRFGDTGDHPTILANASNIAWFGDTVAITHHLNISRLRALELQRPMLRATNTGATAVIDHRGQVSATLPRLTTARLDARVTGREGLTPYARWVSEAGGLWPMGLLAGLVVVAVWLGATRTRGVRIA